MNKRDCFFGAVSFSVTVILGVCVAMGAFANDLRPYTTAEQKMLDDTNIKADRITGWAKSEKLRATEEWVKYWANAVDYWNPLFSDNEYAKNTRWRGVVAAPFFADRFGMPILMDMVANQGVGNWGGSNDGGEIEFFLPIHIGDTFSIYNNRAVIKDITEGEGQRTFSITCSSDLYNQEEEVVCRATVYLTNGFSSGKDEGTGAVHAPREGGAPPVIEPHTYTKDELTFIRQVEIEEEIRGRKVRYWEDVKIGDQPVPVITGPTTVIDMIQFGAHNVLNYPPMRVIRTASDSKEVIVDPNTNVTHLQAEGHYISLSGNSTPGIHYAVYGRSLMARLLTNWMGDDGFLRKFSWKNFAGGEEITREIDMLKDKEFYHHEHIGDTLIAHGIVTGKRVENDEHLVDFIVWIENIDGQIGSAAKAVVRLCSKEDIGD